MKIFIRIAIWIFIFLVVLAIRFPYEALASRAVARLEKSSGISINWEKSQLGWGALTLKDLLVTLPSGSKFKADTARLRFSSGQIKLEFVQNDPLTMLGLESSEKSKALEPSTASLKASASDITFESDNLVVDTGSSDLSLVQVSGNLNFQTFKGEGKGVINLKVPKLKVTMMPFAINNVEIGSKVTIKPRLSSKNKGKKENDKDKDKSKNHSDSLLKITNKIKIFNANVTGEGYVFMYTHKNNTSPGLAGEIEFKTQKFGTHKVSIGGTWAKPEWNLAGAH
ncbi:hypothetical protein IJT10_07195 [bacterium]|nr:hypothetical protein [bacterium]